MLLEDLNVVAIVQRGARASEARVVAERAVLVLGVVASTARAVVETSGNREATDDTSPALDGDGTSSDRAVTSRAKPTVIAVSSRAANATDLTSLAVRTPVIAFAKVALTVTRGTLVARIEGGRAVSRAGDVAVRTSTLRLAGGTYIRNSIRAGGTVERALRLALGAVVGMGGVDIAELFGVVRTRLAVTITSEARLTAISAVRGARSTSDTPVVSRAAGDVTNVDLIFRSSHDDLSIVIGNESIETSAEETEFVRVRARSGVVVRPEYAIVGTARDDAGDVGHSLVSARNSHEDARRRKAVATERR